MNYGKKSYLVFALIALCATLLGACGSSPIQKEQTTGVQSASEQSIKESIEPGEPYSAITVGVLKGPTGMGMTKLMEDGQDRYVFDMTGAPEDMRAKLISGEVDIAALPTNMASVLYNKSDEPVTVLAVNTLGVLYILENSTGLESVNDLQNKTLYLTGQGAAPEYVLQYILEQNSADVEVEYLSEHAELAARMAAGDIAVGMLPEPFVTSALMKNEELRVALDITEEWEKVSDGSSLAMGCIVVTSRFLKENTDLVETFLDDYRESVSFVNSRPGEAAELMEKHDIIVREIAEQAIPNSNIVFVDGEEMRRSVEGFLSVLYEADPQSVGGALPGDDFYYQRHW